VGTGFHPELTGRENIFLNGAILGMGKAEIKRKFDEIVTFSEIEQFLDTPVKRYSSGMYVRLAFSVAAHLDPDTLIVDEVLAVGDAAFQSKCVAKMQETRRNARTVLFVSHNLKAVESFCSRGIVLERGRVTYDGPVKEALKHYLLSQKVEMPPAFKEVIDLSISNHRPGQYSPQLRRLHLMGGDSRPFTGTLPVGGSLKAVIEVELLEPSERVDAELAFFTPLGERVCTAHSAYEPDNKGERLSGRQVFTCDISQLPLVPGEYNLHVGLDVGLKQVDCCRNVAQIMVTGGDFYGTGVEPSQGSFLLKNRWKISGDR
jgi:lipopolysaccharide transport system ATP-binding protein